MCCGGGGFCGCMAFNTTCKMIPMIQKKSPSCWKKETILWNSWQLILHSIKQFLVLCCFESYIPSLESKKERHHTLIMQSVIQKIIHRMPHYILDYSHSTLKLPLDINGNFFIIIIFWILTTFIFVRCSL